MELIKFHKENGYFSSELYHLLEKKRLGFVSDEITPSVYIREMRLTTSERLQSLNGITVDNIVRTSKSKQPKILLSFTPNILIFQNFRPNEKYVAKFSVKNVDTNPVFLNLVYKESSFFSIKPAGSQLLSRLAPGITVSFNLTFAPETFEDYTHKVTFQTDKEQYVLPVIAMSPRPLFDFPDEISFPKSIVKNESFVNIFITNIGSIRAGFTFKSRCPFSITPKSIFLDPDEKIEVIVGFKTMRLGDVTGVIQAVYETGEVFMIKAFGNTFKVSIELEKETVRFLDTYNTLARHLTFKIKNNSPHSLTYVCMKNQHVFEDFEDKLKFATVFYNLRESEAGKYMKLVEYEIISSDEHDRIYARIFLDEIHSLVADDSLTFQNTNFTIDPIRGTIWPNSVTELTVSFNPKSVGEFDSIAYLDVDGVVERMPLKMKGTSIPPLIKLNVETLNMDKVYINKVYNYEVIACNLGDINGLIVYKPQATLFDSVIDCTPKIQCLRPGEKEIFLLSFKNSNQGPYFEEVHFIIQDTDVVIKLYMKGTVIYPSLMFSTPCLDFGDVSLGVPKSLVLEVINESTVEVKALVKISSDGPVLNSIFIDDYAVADIPKPKIPPWPKEFAIEPNTIVIAQESRFPIKITLTANLVRAYQTHLEIELDKSESPPIVLPVTFNAMVPRITPAPDIKIRVCFMDYTYSYDVMFTANEMAGYFTVAEPEIKPTLQVTTAVQEGFIEPFSTICLPIEIKTAVLGPQEFSLEINLFGSSHPIEVCHITAVGVRPIVTCTPLTLQYGHVKLLTKGSKTMTLFNDSPVQVLFKAFLLTRDGNFRIEPDEGVIEPESETDITIHVYLVDACTYSNKAVIQLERVKDIFVSLFATGVGTSIVIGPLRDRIELGRHFTKGQLHYDVTIENHGTKYHMLEWSSNFMLPKAVRDTVFPFFVLSPSSMRLGAGEKTTLTVSGMANKPCLIKESWFLVGGVEGINKKELLLEFPILAEFVDPKVEISTTNLNFRYDHGPYNEYHKLIDLITIKNVSKLPLEIELSLRPPFMFIRKQSYMVAKDEVDHCGCVCYTEEDLNIQNILKTMAPEESQVYIDFLTLKPVDVNKAHPLHFFKDINKMKMVFQSTHTIVEGMDDEDVIKVQIMFDITKHTSLKSKVFTDLMRIKFRGHKNKDFVKLHGEINYPNMFVMAPKLDFRCLLNGTADSKCIKIQNTTPLVVCYKFQWKKTWITVIPPEQPSLEQMSNIIKPLSISEESELEMMEENISDLHEVLTRNSILTWSGQKTNTTSDGYGGKGTESYIASELTFEEYKNKSLKKVIPMLNATYNPDFEWSHKFLVKQKKNITINDVMLLSPHRGVLKPWEEQYIQVMFNPVNNMSVKGILECEVLGGPSETVLVTGQSADLIYSLNTRRINFKIRSFHEIAYEDLVITNTSPLSFEYITYYENIEKSELQGTILEIIPPKNVLDFDQEVPIKIAVRPGVSGYFIKEFILEIGHLPYMTIEVFGWGVIPQIHLCLPRPFINQLPVALGYSAITTLTQEYLDCMDEIFNRRTPEHVNSPLTEKCHEDPELQKEWHICSSQWDGVPSIIDIELAIERLQVRAYLKSRPEILELYKSGIRTGPIPGFYTSPYLLDFGVVMTGSSTTKTLEIVNYGPIIAKLHFSKCTIIPDWLTIKLIGKINPGEVGKVDVTFSPTPEVFTELEQSVEVSMNIEVPFGITVPLKIRSLCAVPFLASNVKILNFGQVRCGDKVTTELPLKNVGKPVCIWYVTLKVKVVGENPLTIMNGSGKYEPGEGGWLRVSFKPSMEMTYEGLLIFRFHMNPNRMTIPVVGQGIVPHLHIIGPNISFPPTLPWSHITEAYFGITNPCPFPVQLIFAHVDDQWAEEEEINTLLNRYYNKPGEILLPDTVPYEGLPKEIMDFYLEYTKRVKQAQEREAAALKNVVKSAASTSKKTKPSPKQQATKGTSTRESAPTKFRTEAEIINDVINEMKSENIDPVNECFVEKKEENAEEEVEQKTKGLIVFMHGSPSVEADGTELAYTLAMQLGIPAINVDLAIIEALCVCEGQARHEMVTMLEEMYLHSSKRIESDTYAGEDSCDNQDQFDIYQKKIEIIATSKPATTPRSKGTERKKPASSRNSGISVLAGIAMFPADMLQDLLTEYFDLPKFKRGFIVDSLTSVIFKAPSLTMISILRSKSSIHNIHLVLCHSDFNKWAQTYEELLLKESGNFTESISKVYEESEIQQIVKDFEEMDQEEYENAPQNLKTIYITYGLEERRKAYYEKINKVESLIVPGRKDTQKKDLKVPVAVGSDAKKKTNKKEEKWKPTSEYFLMNSRYTEYTKVTLENLINIVNNWIVEEQELGFPLLTFTGHVVGAAQKKAKKKSEIQLQTSEPIYRDRGFPFTVLLSPCMQYKDALVNMFLNSPIVKEALYVEEEPDIFTLTPMKDEYSVLHPKMMPHLYEVEALQLRFLDEPPIKKCECNDLFEGDIMIDDSTQEQIYNIFSKWHCSCGKQVMSAQTSTTEIPTTSVTKVSNEEEAEGYYHQPLPLHRVRSIYRPRQRVVLQPHALLRCKFSFNPTVEGNFTAKRYVEISGWPESRIVIVATGISDLPRLDSRPKKMFEKFCRRTVETEFYKHVYLNDVKTLEFGPIFVGAQRIYAEGIKINLKNCSLLTAVIEIQFTDDSSIFTIDKDFIVLEPSARTKLTLSAAPFVVGVHNTVLLLSIKENPEIIEINVQCTGVLPDLEILPSHKNIDYGKLLLYRRQDDRFIVRNNSVLPVMWKIQNPEDFKEDFIISRTTGIVPRNDNHVVPITYIACNVGVIVNQELKLEIYDEQCRGAPMITESLFLSGECYDVLVECAFDHPQNNFLNFGNVKVNSTVYCDMYLLNRGKYNLYYKIKKMKTAPEPSLLKALRVNPECGMIPPGMKLISVEFECTPTISMNVYNMPAFTCSLLDGSKDQIVVAKFPIAMTINSFYNTFTLFPLGELNFHIIPIGSVVIRDVTINNTSKCPIMFEIILPEEHRSPENEAASAAAAVPNKQNTKIKVPPLKCGNFLIVKEDNLLPPGTSRTIQIQFAALAAKRYEETIKFVVSDTCPAEATGVPLKLVGLGAMPTLDFWDLETTFREHLIIKRLSDYKDLESSPHCAFVESNVSMHFFCVTVKTSHRANIYLYNNGVVPCNLNMTLLQSPSNHNVFTLDRYNALIEPLSYKMLSIIFTPQALQEYRAVLEIKIMEQIDSPVFQVCLIGTGNIPRIEITKPKMYNNKIGVLTFPVTCLGSISTKKCSFKNISVVKCKITVKVLQQSDDDRPVFTLSPSGDTEKMIFDTNDARITFMVLVVKPKEIAKIKINFNPVAKGKSSCDLRIKIEDNPYEIHTINCEGEAFMEDIILSGLDMLSMDFENVEAEMFPTAASLTSKKKAKSTASVDKRKKDGKKKKVSEQSLVVLEDPVDLKYLLDFGGCELSSLQKRSVTMLNNSEKVYKFSWDELAHVVIKPSVGYISPGEEKDIEIMFCSIEPIVLVKQPCYCTLLAIDDESLTMDLKGMSWDNRQTITEFKHDHHTSLKERCQSVIYEAPYEPARQVRSHLSIVLLISAQVEYCNFECSLNRDVVMLDTYIYQTRSFHFNVKNTGNVPLKLTWNFLIDEEFPLMIEKSQTKRPSASAVNEMLWDNNDNGDVEMTSSLEKLRGENYPLTEPERKPSEAVNEEESTVTLFSYSSERQSVDTWFEVNLPFTIDPPKECLKPDESRKFKVTFAPLDAFEYKVKIKSFIENLSPDEQNVFHRISAKSLIPFCHLDLEESDYLTSDRRKALTVLPRHTQVLEFNVVGAGCYKKSFNIINPTSDGYEFYFEQADPRHDMAPVHCANLKGYVEGGTSYQVTFTISPTSAGLFESLWKFLVVEHLVTIPLLVVGHVREPEVMFIPKILLLRNSIVGFLSTATVKLKNFENLSLKYKFTGDSISTAFTKSPVVMEPEEGVLKPNSETLLKISYTPLQDGPLMFKVFCEVQYMSNLISLCVNALSFCIKPTVTYMLLGNEHVLDHEVLTNIHIDQTASSYERMIPFKIKNDGSATFFFDWDYVVTPVKKYLTVSLQPKSGHVSPGATVDCELHFLLNKVQVHEYPVTLTIVDGPVYNIYLFAEILHPKFHFTCTDINFGKCFINMADNAYKKHIAFVNDDDEPVLISMDFTYLPELYIEYQPTLSVPAKEKLKFTIYFRPKEIKLYDIKVPFRINSLCETIMTVKGEGVPLLLDVYEGCHRSYDLGAVKIGEMITRQLEVMNHSKKAVNVSFEFKDSSMSPVVADVAKSDTSSACLSQNEIPKDQQENNPGSTRVKSLYAHIEKKIQEQRENDVKIAVASLKVIPSQTTIKPHSKVPIKIKFKPTGFIDKLDVQMYARVGIFERPLVRLSGRSTGMLFMFNMSSLQFGRVRKYGRKVSKVMLMNKGDYGTRFWWQPLTVDDFMITPMKGYINAKSNVTFTIVYRPKAENPFVKVWASCNIDNYGTLELAMYATCVDVGVMLSKTLGFEIHVRGTQTNYINVTNPTDEPWLVQSEVSSPAFETLREFVLEPFSEFEIPITFRPLNMGKHEEKVLFTGLADSALFVTLIGAATQPIPNNTITITVVCKEPYTEKLPVYCISGVAETYVVCSEVIKVNPAGFTGHYEMHHPETVKVWGDAVATIPWTLECYEECEMMLRVFFINQDTREYQYYDIAATVVPSQIKEIVRMTARARETVTANITIENPLLSEQEFVVNCEKVTCLKQFRIGKKSETILTLTYAPLVVGKVEEMLEVNNNMMGTVLYKLILECLPAKVKNLEYTTPFGTYLSIRLKVQNYTEEETDFIATTSHPSIQLEKDYSLDPLEKSKFRVTFEPVQLGMQHCIVKFNSPIAGEFVYHIKGIATEPEPQGPIEIRPGGYANIKCKNVFETTQVFQMYTDREDFYLKTFTETVKPKKELRVTVYMVEKSPNWKKPPTGCLYIETSTDEKIQWTYFLQGV